MVYRGCRAFYRLAYTLFFHIRAWGAEKVPREGGALLVSNHQSFLDPPGVGIPLTRPVYYVARSTLFRLPILGWLMYKQNGIPIERGKGDLGAIRTAVDLAKRGAMIVLFPEGTRSRDGSVGRFQPGFAMVAALAKVPIVPAAVHGAFDAWPRSRKLPCWGRVQVAYGEPLPPPEGGRAACEAAAEEVRRRVVALVEELKEREQRSQCGL